jgi:hypothetical protein
MNAAEKLKKIIREEVRRAVRQEMGKILNERVEAKKSYASSLENQVKSGVSNTKKSTQTKKQIPARFDNSNPFAQLLQETALSFTTDDVRGFSNTGQVSHGEYFQPNEAKVGDVGSMLNSARKSSNIDMVQIDTVPDFSAIMNKMKQNGQI